MNRVSPSLTLAALLFVVATNSPTQAAAPTAPAVATPPAVPTPLAAPTAPVVATSPAVTPPVPPLVPVPATTSSWRPIAVKYVPPRILANWLDPAHNSMPAELQPLGFTKENSVTSTKNGAFALPTGIESIFPVDAQNILLVLGTEEGVQKLQGVMALLDRPLRQIEIDANVVEMKPEDYQKFGFTMLDTNEDNGTYQLAFVRGNFQAQLEKLKTQNKARVLQAPRVTALNNQSAVLTTTDAQPVVLATKDARGRTSELFETTGVAGDLGLSIGREFKFAVTPSINSDGTVTILIAPTMNLILTTKDSAQPLVLQNLGALQTVANVRDGDTVALTGLTTRLASLSNDAKAAPANVVLFVTTRLVRRLGEAEVQPVALLH